MKNYIGVLYIILKHCHVSLEQTKKSFKLEAGSWTGDARPMTDVRYVNKNV